MKKHIVTAAILIGIVLGINLILRVSGIFIYYKIIASSGEPNLNPGNRVFVTNLITPKRFDYICYNQSAGESWTGGKWIMRVCGMPGDKIQVFNGVLYINDHIADNNLRLKQEWIISRNEIVKLPEDYFVNNPEDITTDNSDSVDVFIPNDLFISAGLKGHLRIYTASQPEIEKAYGHSWSPDNFGPVYVPATHYFVLGDNRHQAPDSRYTGFIDQKNLIGTICFKRR